MLATFLNIYFLVLVMFLTLSSKVKSKLNFCLCSKTLQKSRHVAMGRKKFNMDPKKVTVFLLFVNFDVFFAVNFHVCLSAGYYVPGGERAAQTHIGGHRTVLVQRRRPQQDCYRRLPGREVKEVQIPHEPFVFLLFVTVVPFFSCRDDFNIKVLQAFVDLHEFTDLNLVQALR